MGTQENFKSLYRCVKKVIYASTEKFFFLINHVGCQM